MKIALYDSADSICGPIILKVSKHAGGSANMIRVSEIAEIEFKELAKPPKAMVAEMKVAAAQKNFDDAKKKLEALKNEQ